MENKRTLRYIAGACFAIYAVLIVVSLVRNGFYAGSLFPLIGAVLIAVSMFASIPVLTTVGSALHLVSAAGTLIGYIILMLNDYSWFLMRYLLYSIMFLVIWFFLLIASINTKSAKSMGIIAGIVAAVHFVAVIIGNIADGGSIGLTFLNVLSYLVIIAGALLIGLSSEASEINQVTSSVSSDKAQIQQGSDNTIERLTKLKALLDNGVITQEEFDSKKKQIIGM